MNLTREERAEVDDILLDNVKERGIVKIIGNYHDWSPIFKKCLDELPGVAKKRKEYTKYTWINCIDFFRQRGGLYWFYTEKTFVIHYENQFNVVKTSKENIKTTVIHQHTRYHKERVMRCIEYL